MEPWGQRKSELLSNLKLIKKPSIPKQLPKTNMILLQKISPLCYDTFFCLVLEGVISV